MEFSSKLLEKAVSEMAQLPGIGKRTALRLVLHLLKQPSDQTRFLSESLLTMRNDIRFCTSCHNISDTELCQICANTARNHQLICVVEDIRDVMAIENTGQYKGIYHVLGGVINPLEHVGPEDLKIDELIERVKNKLNGKNECLEVILATNPTMEGEATALYIKKKLEGLGVKISRIGSGLPIGADLEYADQATLCRALDGRKDI